MLSVYVVITYFVSQSSSVEEGLYSMKKIKTYLIGVYSMLLLFSCVEDQDFNQFTPDGSIAATDVQEAIQEVRDEAGSGGYEILVSSGFDHDVNTALATAGTTPVRITEDIIDWNAPFMMDSGQTLIFEGITIYVDPNATDGEINEKAVIMNKNVTDSLITVIGGTINGNGQIDRVYRGVEFDSVYNSTIKNIRFNSVLIRTAPACGNIDVRNSHNVLVQNITSLNTQKSGIYFEKQYTYHY